MCFICDFQFRFASVCKNSDYFLRLLGKRYVAGHADDRPPPGVEADGAGRDPRAYSTFTGIFRKGGRLIYAAEASATSAN